MLFNDKTRKLDNGMTIKDVTIQVTGDCNLACTYCYLHNKNHQMLNIEDGKKFIDKIVSGDETFWNGYIDFKHMDGIQLQFIGGEPMCNYKAIIALCDYYTECCKKYNRMNLYKYTTFGICTNGTIFNQEIADFLNKYRGKVDISISIDGCKELHDTCRRFKNSNAPSYDIVIENLYKYRALMPECRPVNTKATISPDNVYYVAESIKNLAGNLQFRKIPMNCVHEEGWQLEHAKILYQQMKEAADWLLNTDYIVKSLDMRAGMKPDEREIGLFCDWLFFPRALELSKDAWCGGNGKMIFMQYDGKLYNCNRYSETAIGDPSKDLPIGHVNEGITNVQNVNFLRSATYETMYDDECINCPVGTGCSDCIAYCYEKFGEFKKAKFICDMHKARSLANVYFWNKYYIKTNQDRIFLMHLPYQEALKYIDEVELEMLLDLSNRRYIKEVKKNETLQNNR